MTPADPLDAVRAEGRRLLAEATEGPWHQVAAAAWSGTNKDPDLVADCPLYADAIAIVWLRNHADALLADPAPEGLSEEHRRWAAMVRGDAERITPMPGTSEYAVLSHLFTALDLLDRLSASTEEGTDG